jgi:hypothetical protein
MALPLWLPPCNMQCDSLQWMDVALLVCGAPSLARRVQLRHVSPMLVRLTYPTLLAFWQFNFQPPHPPFILSRAANGTPSHRVKHAIICRCTHMKAMVDKRTTI